MIFKRKSKIENRISKFPVNQAVFSLLKYFSFTNS